MLFNQRTVIFLRLRKDQQMDFFKCEGLTKHKGDFLLKDVSFSIPRGTVVGLIGMNGCGKTTLLRTILGSYGLEPEKGDKGVLLLDGTDHKKDQKLFRQNLGFVLQDNPFSRTMKVMEVGETYGYYYEGFSIETYRRLLQEYDVPERSAIALLSAGESLRMQLAFARSYPAKLYIMDEPAGNLDVNFRDYFYDSIREMVEDESCSVIISSHLVTELEHIADMLLWIGRNENESTVRYFGDIDSFRDSYRIIEGDKAEISSLPEDMVLGRRLRENHSEALIYRENKDFSDMDAYDSNVNIRYASLQEIMYYVEKSPAEEE